MMRCVCVSVDYIEFDAPKSGEFLHTFVCLHMQMLYTFIYILIIRLSLSLSLPRHLRAIGDTTFRRRRLQAVSYRPDVHGIRHSEHGRRVSHQDDHFAHTDGARRHQQHHAEERPLSARPPPQPPPQSPSHQPQAESLLHRTEQVSARGDRQFYNIYLIIWFCNSNLNKIARARERHWPPVFCTLISGNRNYIMQLFRRLHVVRAPSDIDAA